MKLTSVCIAAVVLGSLAQVQGLAADSATTSLPEVKRIFVAPLVGSEAEALRELIIASLDSTRLFILTDNPDRADAILKGAADDHVFTDTHDMEDGISTRQSGGKSGSSTTTSRAGSGFAGISISEHEAHHSKELKHEAYASVRLCSTNGDVLWSTNTGEPRRKIQGSKRGCSCESCPPTYPRHGKSAALGSCYRWSINRVNVPSHCSLLTRNTGNQGHIAASH